MKYTVYYEPRMLQFLSSEEEVVGLPTTSMVTAAPGELWQFFSKWAEEPGSGDAALVSRDSSRLFRAFASHFELVEAAGGLVTCPTGEVLMIYRNGFWDLPKGKLDTGERAEEAGIREVEEECAVSGLTIKGTLPTSFHVYTLKGERWMLKKTQWFYMHAETKQFPRPQLDEQITRAEWISPSSLKPLLTKSYRSIADLIRIYIDLSV